MDSNQIIELVINKDNVVTKSNRLIEAEYKMTATEFKIVQTVFSNIQPKSDRHSTFVFPVRQFMDMLGLKGESGYAELKRITLNLFKPVQISVDGETKQVSWFQYVNYNNKEGTVTIEVNSFWQEFLYSLEGNFTSYKLLNITRLNSSYSPRIYELLKARVGLNSQRILSLKELRAKLGIQEGQYPLYANFKQRVLLPAQRELKAQSDISFDFKEIKSGRAVKHIEFIIHRNNQNKIIEPELEKPSSAKKALMALGITKEAVEELVKKYDEKRIMDNIDYTRKRNNVSKINNLAAYLKTAIEKNYAKEVTSPDQRLGDYDKFDKEMAEKNKNDTRKEEAWEGYVSTDAEKVEELLVTVIEAKKKWKASEEAIERDVRGILTNFQTARKNVDGKYVSQTKFKNPLIKKICKLVVKELKESE